MKTKEGKSKLSVESCESIIYIIEEGVAETLGRYENTLVYYMVNIS